MMDPRDREAEAYVIERAQREQQERARATGPDGRYLPLPPSREALRDIVERAMNEYGSWMRPTPSGYWFDVVEAARELETLRAENERLRRVERDHERLLGALAAVIERGGRIRCEHCGRPATCVGAYEDDRISLGCDECCGHGNEDGWCERLSRSVLEGEEG